jgi:hypothetical protein
MRRETRSMSEIVAHLQDVQSWDVPGHREAELLRVVPGPALPPGSWQRDAGCKGAAQLENSLLRATWLLEMAEVAVGGGSLMGFTPDTALVRVEEALWLAGASTDALGELRLKAMPNRKKLFQLLRDRAREMAG